MEAPGTKMTARDKLIATIKRQGLPTPQAPLPVVTLEEFFEGNTDLGSIGCNLSDHPGIDEFYRVLKSVRARGGVQDVLVEIYEVEESDPDMWPFSERIYILADARLEDVAWWVELLDPSEVSEGWAGEAPAAAPKVQAHVFGVWWD